MLHNCNGAGADADDITTSKQLFDGRILYLDDV